MLCQVLLVGKRRVCSGGCNNPNKDLFGGSWVPGLSQDCLLLRAVLCGGDLSFAHGRIHAKTEVSACERTASENLHCSGGMDGGL